MNIVCAESVLAAEAAFKSIGNCIILPDNKIDRSSLIDADALIIRSKTKVDNRLLQDSNVRFVGSATAGKDHLDIRWLEENNIIWSVASGCNANSVSEYVITSLLHLAKKNNFKLKNKTIGIIGCGNVGRAVIKKSHVLGMKVLQNDPIRATEEIDFPHIPLPSMLPECDIVTIHTPLTKEVAWPTENLANYEFFENLKPGAIFINTSRGEVCDYNVWLQSQYQRHLSGSIIDVWESEPNLNADHIKASSISTAHIAGHSAEGKLNGGSDDGVSYTGQTARLVLQQKLTDFMVDIVEQEGESTAIYEGMRFYMTGEGADFTDHGFTTKGGDPVIPGPTYGDISSGKNLNGKIAGGSLAGTGETGKVIDIDGDGEGDFFGWKTGLDVNPRPIDLVDLWMKQFAAEAADGVDPTITIADGSEVNIATPMISKEGVHYRQLIQKFLSVAVNFSQGTNDYLLTDFGSVLGPYKDKNYSTAAHKFDEGFGYYGASRDINDYTDDEAAGKGGRAEYSNGYYDSNGDGLIDLRSEFVFGHAQNCAKRDRLKDAEGNPYTDFSKEAMDAFMIGRRILQNAEEAGELTEAANEALQAQIKIAAVAWEKCIAATVVHYINDVTIDMGGFTNGAFADRSNFVNLAKHWGEMKGFALALQFSPFSPFRDGSVAGTDLDDLKTVLTLMGDAPVLADGSQNGVVPFGPASSAIANYREDLLQARDILQAAYEFDPTVVANW